MKKELEFIIKQEPDDGHMVLRENIEIGSTGTDQKLKVEVEKLKKELESVKNEHSKLLKKNKILIHENKSMAARIKQLQYGTESVVEAKEKKRETKKIILNETNRDASDGSTDEDMYEVEKIISHKIKGGTELFLIRWKGFDSSNDTWERKENLNCPKKLKEYLSQA